MYSQESEIRTDAALLPFLRAPDGQGADDILAELVAEQTEATIKGVIRNRLRVSLSRADGSRGNQDALELLRDVQAALVAELRGLKSNRDGKTISDLHGYVTSVAFNACHQYLRRKYPRRFQLKNKLRYLITHRPGLALWEGTGGELVCGFTVWRDQGKEALTWSDMERFQEGLRDAVRAAEGVDERATLVNLVTGIFERLGGPVILNDLVTLVADLGGIKEPVEAAQAGERTNNDFEGLIPDLEPSVITRLEQRAQLQKLWAEVRQLPLRHRSALLLNLRGQGREGVITLLPLTRVATIREIAAALSFSPEEFARVWNELPWDDAAIARHLGVTRQQVINLRQSARSRLARRLKHF